MEKLVKYHNWSGVEGLSDLINSFDDIIVYFDPDVDGMISGYFVCKFISMLGKKFQWYVNSDRGHNWDIDIGKLHGKDIIAVDFMIPENIIEDIVTSGSNIISMDHHVNQDSMIDISKKGKRGVVINNQYPFEEDDGRFLSGAGVVFETLRLLNKKFDNIENRALVGLTLLSDVCDIENPIARGYLYDLYNHKYKGYIRYLIDNTLGDKDFGFGVPRLDRKYVDYKFSPAINSCLRFNKEDDVVKFFLGSGKLDLSYHKKQKSLISSMKEVANVVEFSNLSVVYVKDWEVSSIDDIHVIPNFIGLLASNYLKGKSVIAYVISKMGCKNIVSRASFRGNINSLDYLGETKNLIHGVGHPSAFGILDLKPTKDLFVKVNDVCRCLEKDKVSVSSNNVIETTNLSMLAKRKGNDIAEYNMYCLAQHNRYIRYVGSNISIVREGASYRKYKVDGIDVTSFDIDLDFTNGLIYPILERGYIYYYLQKV